MKKGTVPFEVIGFLLIIAFGANTWLAATEFMDTTGDPGISSRREWVYVLGDATGATLIFPLAGLWLVYFLAYLHAKTYGRRTKHDWWKVYAYCAFVFAAVPVIQHKTGLSLQEVFVSWHILGVIAFLGMVEWYVRERQGKHYEEVQ